MKVFLVGPQPPPVQGAAVVHAALGERIAARGTACIVIDLVAPPSTGTVLGRFARLPRVIAGLGRLALRGRPSDCLYMSVSGGAGQAYDIAFAVLGRLLGLRLFLHHHSFAYIDRRALSMYVLAAAAGPRAVHVALSAGMGPRLCARYPRVRELRVVSNLAWLPGEGEPAYPRRGLRTIGFLGNLAVEKGVLDFLEVAAAAQASHPDLRFRLAGPFQDEATELEVWERLRRLPNVAYDGPRYGADKQAWLDGLDLLLFPTRYANEAEPLVVHEAMLRGVPVVGRRRGALGEMLSGGGGSAIDPRADFRAAALRLIHEWRDAPERLSGASLAALRRSQAMRVRATRAAEALLDEACGAPATGKVQDLRSFRLPGDFRGRPAWLVQLWWLVQATFFGCSPQFLYGWRRWLLRRFGASVAAGVRIRPSARVTLPWKVSIGEAAWIGDDVVLYSLGPISIGADCVVSQRSYLCAATHDYQRRSFDILAEPIVLEDQCWLAADVFVAPGTTIRQGAVVGARSSVFSDLPAHMVCFGSPARAVSPRSGVPRTRPRGPRRAR